MHSEVQPATERMKGGKTVANTHFNKDARPERPSYNQIINNVIKESGNQEVIKLKDEIDGIKKVRNVIISKIKDNRKRLGYKEAESVAVGKLLEMEKRKDADGAKRNKIGFLKRLKNEFEFKISTEASSLAVEKGLIRKIEQINKELNEAYRTIRLERKNEFVKKDIEGCVTVLKELEAQIVEHDKKLDVLYDKLRKLLGIERNQRQREALKPKKKVQHAPPHGINLEDIAVFKKKEKKTVEDEEEGA